MWIIIGFSDSLDIGRNDNEDLKVGFDLGDVRMRYFFINNEKFCGYRVIFEESLVYEKFLFFGYKLEFWLKFLFLFWISCIIFWIYCKISEYGGFFV